jgi:hypothetical protein
MGVFSDIAEGAVKGFFVSLFQGLRGIFFPPKTAADQKAADLSASVTEANDAIQIDQKVDQEPISDVDDDLARRMRGSSSSGS